MAARILLVGATLALWPASPDVRSQAVPRETDYREDVLVELAQVEVTVWPKKQDDTALCRGFTADDFEVTVNGRAREITAVDWLGSLEARQAMEAAPVGDPGQTPLTLVLYFDLWHLDLFYPHFRCPITKPLAFDQARELVRTRFRPGDRLLLVTFAGWPVIHEGWIRDPAHALHALDRLEVSPSVANARKTHSHHQEWIAGIESLLLALGRYPGRKEMFYLGDDFRFDDVSLQVFDLAARAQANGVSVHAVDLLASCRSVPGPGCPEVRVGGLGCTEFRRPIALGYVSTNTGGGLFDNGETLAEAVAVVRRMQGCKYLISFPIVKKDRKHSPKTIVRVKRKGFQLHFPSSFGSPRREPDERERQDALFLLPRFGKGIHAEVGLWTLRPSRKGKRWKGVMIGRLQRSTEEPWPDGIERIEIEAVAHGGSKVYDTFRKVIAGEELARFRNGDSRLFVFPLDEICEGPNSAVLRAVGVGGDVSANVRADLDVPKPPGAGEAGPWFLVDRLARVGGITTVLPTLDGSLAHGHGGLIMGFGCRGTEPSPGAGRLVALDREEVDDVPIDWFDPPSDHPSTAGPPTGEHCGWLVGRVEPNLDPGLWRFEPPASLRREEERSGGVEFRVAGADEEGSSGPR